MQSDKEIPRHNVFSRENIFFVCDSDDRHIRFIFKRLVINCLGGYLHSGKDDLVALTKFFKCLPHDQKLSAVIVPAKNMCLQNGGFYSETNQIVCGICSQIGADFIVIAVLYCKALFRTGTVAGENTDRILHEGGI